MVCSKKSGDCLIFYCLCNSFWVTAKLLLFSRSGVSDSLQPHGLQHARLPCLSLSPRACSNSCPFSQWCHSTILSYVIPFSSCLRFFPASRCFLMSWLFASGGQSIGASISASAQWIFRVLNYEKGRAIIKGNKICVKQFHFYLSGMYFSIWLW